MKVSRIGVAVLKGTQHQARSSIELTRQGPIGDRLFCLVDESRRQVLKTVEHTSLIASTVTCSDGVLDAEVAGRRFADAPVPTGARLEVDYWGRRVDAEILSGPWAHAYSGLLGKPVLLVRVQAGDIVYGNQVSLVTTSAVAGLRAPTRAGFAPTTQALDPDRDSARFRSTVVIDTRDSPYAKPGAELEWIGRDLRLGTAVVRLTSAIVRCAVVNLDPSTGHRDLALLKVLPLNAENEPIFGLQGDVVEPGLVEHGASVALVERRSSPTGPPGPHRHGTNR